jgi:hypothetical protein
MDGSPGRDGMRRPEAPLAYRRDEPQVPPLRFAPVRMTIQWISGEKNMARLESRAVSNPYLAGVCLREYFARHARQRARLKRVLDRPLRTLRGTIQLPANDFQLQRALNRAQLRNLGA